MKVHKITWWPAKCWTLIGGGRCLSHLHLGKLRGSEKGRIFLKQHSWKMCEAGLVFGSPLVLFPPCLVWWILRCATQMHFQGRTLCSNCRGQLIWWLIQMGCKGLTTSAQIRKTLMGYSVDFWMVKLTSPCAQFCCLPFLVKMLIPRSFPNKHSSG